LWIESLAAQENSILSGERTGLDISQTKEDILSLESSLFLQALYSQYESLVPLFNTKCPNPVAKLALSSTLAEGKMASFYIHRNAYRLILGKQSQGFINFRCEKDREGETPHVLFSGTVEAVFGQFHEIHWDYLTSPITAEQLALHCFTEFIQTSHPIAP